MKAIIKAVEGFASTYCTQKDVKNQGPPGKASKEGSKLALTRPLQSMYYVRNFID
jgi:hypothetical protein